MFDHVTLRTGDRDASERFYATVLEPLGIAGPSRGTTLAWGDFGLVQAEDPGRVTSGLHLAFVAPGREHVEAFWRAGLAIGAPDDGAPGPRPQYREDYVGAFLRDPDANSAEAVHHGAMRRGGHLDHLWIRVPDVERSARFYAAIAPHAGLRLSADGPGFVHVTGSSGSFSLVAAEDAPPTRNLHLAFPAADPRAVEAFHAAALAAGGRDHRAPGERGEHHPGSVAASVLDPDGAEVGMVHHGR